MQNRNQIVDMVGGKSLRMRARQPRLISRCAVIGQNHVTPCIEPLCPRVLKNV